MKILHSLPAKNVSSILHQLLKLKTTHATIPIITIGLNNGHSFDGELVDYVGKTGENSILLCDQDKIHYINADEVSSISIHRASLFTTEFSFGAEVPFAFNREALSQLTFNSSAKESKLGLMRKIEDLNLYLEKLIGVPTKIEFDKGLDLANQEVRNQAINILTETIGVIAELSHRPEIQKIMASSFRVIKFSTGPCISAKLENEALCLSFEPENIPEFARMTILKAINAAF